MDTTGHKATARTFYRWADGHTYWKEGAGWMGAPTLIDGTPDMEGAGYISDFDLSPDEIRALETELARRVRPMTPQTLPAP